MTTSGTSTFDVSRDQLIQDALFNVGAIGPNKTPTGNQLLHAARQLNLICKSMDADGQFLWSMVRRTLNLTASTATYTLGSDVIDIDEPASFYKSGTTSRTPVMSISRDEYMGISDRTITGIPTSYFVERALPTTFTLTLWPVPTTTGDKLDYVAFTRRQDYTTGANTGDFPAKWGKALLYALSAELAPGYGQPQTASYYNKRFQEERDRQLNADTEREGLRMIPFGGVY